MDIPNHLRSEANVQAEIYSVFKAAGLNVSLEVTTPVGRLDVGVFSEDWGQIRAIVECKKSTGNWRGKEWVGPQIKRYQRIGVPVFKWARMDCQELLLAVLAVPKVGVDWAVVQAMEKKVRQKRKHKFNPETDLDDSLIYRQ